MRDHVVDALEADVTYPLYITRDKIVDGSHRLAQLLAQQKRTARTIDVTDALPTARLEPASSYAGQVYVDDKHSYGIDLIHEYVKQHTLPETQRDTAQLAQLNTHPWGKEVPLAHVVAALETARTGK